MIKGVVSAVIEFSSAIFQPGTNGICRIYLIIEKIGLKNLTAILLRLETTTLKLRLHSTRQNNVTDNALPDCHLTHTHTHTFGLRFIIT